MKGDFSRNTFDKNKHYSSVRMQQGRVQLDADWNEQMDILDNRIRIGSQDFIGGSGTPSGNAGYKVTVTTAKTDFTISKGRYYVQGILIDNNKDFTYSSQSLPKAVTLAEQKASGLYLAYLDVWQQGVSAIDDTSISEPALNGADTSVRIRNIAQVKLVKLVKDPTGLNLKCETIIDNNTENKTIWQKTIAASTGKLSAKVNATANLKNQLYRVEIHQGGNENTATFKWSRNNGALTGKITAINGNDITISEIDNNVLNFKASQWLELTSNKRELQQLSGIFVQLQKVSRNILTIVGWPSQTKSIDFVNGIIRQWDSVDTFILKHNNNIFLAVTNFKVNTTTITLDVPIKTNTAKFTIGEFVELRSDINKAGVFVRLKMITNSMLTLESVYSFSTIPKYIRPVGSAAIVVNHNDTLITLENGLQIKFEKGTYRRGDYWLLPTRANTTNPIVSTQYNFSIAQSPEGILHDYTPLALVRKKADKTWEIAGDCRNIISALGNKAYQSDNKAPASSVYVDKDGNVNITKNLQAKNFALTATKNNLPKANQLGYIDSQWLMTPTERQDLLADRWISDLQAMPTARYSLNSNAVNGKIYVMGGWSSHALKTVEMYDPLLNKWHTKASLLQARWVFTSSTVNGKIYVMGGLDRNTTDKSRRVLNSVEEYDPLTNQWQTKANMLTPRWYLTSSVVNGKVYVIGGYNDKNEQVATVEEYDPATNQWQTKKSMPTVRANLTSSVVNGKIYVIGGSNVNGYLSTIEEYDPFTDKWTTKAAMSIGRHNLTSSVINGKIYAIGGSNKTSKRVSLVEEYDPIANKWTSKAVMPTIRDSSTSSAVNGKLYVIGGHGAYGSTATLDIVEQYNPQTDSWKSRSIAPMLTARTTFTVSIVNGKIYAIGRGHSDAIVEEYDVNKNSWLAKKTMPVSRDAFASSVANGKIYTFGGNDEKTGKLNTVEVYNPATDTWGTETSMLSKRTALTASTVNGKIYVIGGDSSTGSITNIVEEYDLKTKKWLAKKPMPTARNTMTSSVVNGKIVVIGGYGSLGPLSIVEEYDPIKNTWTTKRSMPTARSALTSSVVNGKIYVFGGYDGNKKQMLGTVEAYDPIADTWTTHKSMPTAKRALASRAINGKVYVMGGYDGHTYVNTVEIYQPASASKKALQADINAPTKSVYIDKDGNVKIKKDITVSAVTKTASLTVSEKTSTKTLQVGTAATSIDTITTSLSANRDTALPTEKAVQDAFSVKPSKNKIPKANTAGRIDLKWLFSTDMLTRLSQALAEEWLMAASMSTRRSGFSSSVVNGKIYVIGGNDNDHTISQTIRLQTVEAYDPISNNWSNKAAISNKRAYLTSSVVNGKIYAIGGLEQVNTANVSVNTVEEYNPVTNNWISKKSMPTKRHFLTSSVVNGKIYVIGGYNGATLNLVEEYDSATNTWDTKKPMPTPRYYLTSSVVNGKIYVIGGYNNGQYVATVEEYDPATNTWSTKKSMPTARGRLTSGAVNGKIYAIGGYNTDALNIVEEYNPLTDSWRIKKSMSIQRFYLTSSVVNNKLYVFGGGHIDGVNKHHALKTVEFIQPALNLNLT